MGGNLWLRSSIAGRSLDWVLDASLGRVQRRLALDAFVPEPVPKLRQGRLSITTSVPWLPDGVATAAPRLDLRLSVQRVANPFAPSDLPLIGTRYAVRGFNGDAPLQGQQVAVLRSDWRWPAMAIVGGMAQLAPYVGLDFGAVHRPIVAGQTRWLSGLTFGLQARAGHAAVELALATPLHTAEPAAPQRWVPSVSISVDI